HLDMVGVDGSSPLERTTLFCISLRFAPLNPFVSCVVAYHAFFCQAMPRPDYLPADVDTRF
ncbi:hypothetical protein, partial [Mixta calida]|uniref:hypothetical protein n=1 Tax=Mixta calida TaxID=665913 RepID=UPI001C65DF87